jgi:pimeloyl-ACP methyl ester carboxylesterase
MQVTRGTLASLDAPTPWILVQPNDQKGYCILWLGGWGSTIEKHTPQITALARHAQVAVAMIDYAGHGSHPSALGTTTREQQLHEAIAAFDELKTIGYKRIIVAGNSFGGYMGALLSAERDAYALILREPAIYKDDEFSLPYPERQGYRDKVYEEMKFTVTSESDMQALHAVARFNRSVYVIEHEIDSVIPKNIPRAYFTVAKRGNYLVIPATDHAVAKMPQPENHYAYITAAIAHIVDLIMREDSLLEAK